MSRESAIYALGSVAGKAVGLAMLPILTRLLVPSEYGRLDLLSTTGSALISALLLGLDAAAVRLGADADVTGATRRRVFGSWIALSTVLAGVAAVVLLAFAVPASVAVVGSTAAADSVRALAGVVVFGTYYTIGLGLLRVQRRPLAYASISAATLVINAMAAIVLVAWIAPTSTSVLIALAISWALGAGLTFMAAGFGAVGAPSRIELRRLLLLAIPLAPAVAATWLGEVLTRVMVLNATSAEELGYLSVAIRIAAITGLFVTGFQLGWLPHAYSAGTTSQALRSTSLDGRRILIVVICSVVAVTSVAPLAVQLAGGPGYTAAVGLVAAVAFAQFATCVFLVASMPSALAKRTLPIGFAGLIAMISSVLITWLAVQGIGANGFGIGTGAGQLIGAIVVWFTGSRFPAFQVGWPRVFVIGLALVLLLIALNPSVAPPTFVVLGAWILFGAVLACEGTARDLVVFSLTRVTRTR